MKRKYIPVPVPVGSPTPPAPVINRMSAAEWSALDFEEKIAEGLTLVGGEHDITGDWYDMTTALIDFSSPVLAHFATGTTGTDETFTATAAGTYFVINSETVGEAQSEKKSDADIATTGTEICNVVNTSEYAATGSRDLTCAVAVITLAVGETITLTNNHSNNFSNQVHLIFAVAEGFDLSNELAASRSVSPFTETYTATENTTVIAFVIDDTPVGDAAEVTIATTGGNLGSYTGGVNKCKVAVINADLETGNTVTMTTGSYTNYGSKTFMVYEIVPA